MASQARLKVGGNEPSRISVECLRCGHRGELRESDLPSFGEKPDAPIAAFIKRLTCHKCGSHSVRAYRKM